MNLLTNSSATSEPRMNRIGLALSTWLKKLRKSKSLLVPMITARMKWRCSKNSVDARSWRTTSTSWRRDKYLRMLSLVNPANGSKIKMKRLSTQTKSSRELVRLVSLPLSLMRFLTPVTSLWSSSTLTQSQMSLNLTESITDVFSFSSETSTELSVLARERLKITKVPSKRPSRNFVRTSFVYP